MWVVFPSISSPMARQYQEFINSRDRTPTSLCLQNFVMFGNLLKHGIQYQPWSKGWVLCLSLCCTECDAGELLTAALVGASVQEWWRNFFAGINICLVILLAHCESNIYCKCFFFYYIIHKIMAVSFITFTLISSVRLMEIGTLFTSLPTASIPCGSRQLPYKTWLM